MILRCLKSRPDQIDVVLRGLDAKRRLFLEAMQNINRAAKTNGINGTVGVRIEVLNQLKDPRTSKAPKRLCIRMLLAALCQIQSMTKNVLYI
ncbi:hypothetical protein PS918_04485 [Pseudomonas fluorescens]|uniref:Uncharacterized protein n=1 Tax=Pseudomonas fluorescens TaxID=294 RepID=A0A5E7U0K1_PSEFL|nr:hypothetical protein PS918_04485 [Pseudomonas fluorescens]